VYYVLLIALVALGFWLTQRGWRGRRRSLVAAGIGVTVVTLATFSVLSLWGEMLWFESLGYGARFWTILSAQALALAVGLIAGAGGVYLLGLPLAPRWRHLLWGATAAGAVLGGLWGMASWDEALLFIYRVAAGVREPILGLDAGFYLFTLPFLYRVAVLVTGIAVIVAGAALISVFGLERSRRVQAQEDLDPLPLYVASAALGMAFALYQVLAVFALLNSDLGVVHGPGWTDVHVRLPAHLFAAAVALTLTLAPLWPPARRLLAIQHLALARLAPTATGWAAVMIVLLAGVGIAPAMVQWLVVEPNEVTLERPYIENNIRFTRIGFGLNRVEERQFPANEELTREMVRVNRHLLENVRLWDWRALDAVYRQFQEIRLYYEFADVDVDRYTIGDRYREVMVSAREMAQNNLPAESRTFVNRRFIYTHGYGITMATVSEFTPDGLPHLLVKDIPPHSESPGLAVKRPQIYYGELTDGPVVVNSRRREFDYPSGEENVYIRYPGKGGVQLSTLWRKFLFGWKFDGTRFLLSSYPTRESRVMFHRDVQERVATVAPFLHLDQDPYIALVDGRLYWIVDAYTTSSDFPYSARFSPRGPVAFDSRVIEGGALRGANYVRNSVKAVVDAFSGAVKLYVFSPNDPLIRTWRKALPHLFMDSTEMPAGLRAHVRYPADFLLTQGLVYAKYHMTDPSVFYNQEDLWVRATEKHYDAVVKVDPYYVMWQRPGATSGEFSLILPFTPKNRQVLIGWIAGLCDGDNYGRFIAYKFPKETRVLGPQQVESKIDQDRYLSAQLSLWDQRGSKVIRGNVLAIPIDDTLIYVEPIYLEAETAAYPELRLVVVMHGDQMSYAQTFDAALDGLFGAPAAMPAIEGMVVPGGPSRSLARRADDAFRAYLKLQAERRFEEAARKLDELSRLLRELAGGAGRRQPPGKGR
jgi:uncharacterized membrane protein (UPF0182 family)